MRGYSVHLLFHVLAIVVGFAAGTAAGLWWFAHDRIAIWLAGGAVVVGVLLLILQVVYISGSQPRERAPRVPAGRRPHQRTGGTRPELRASSQSSGTLVQPMRPDAPYDSDEQTRTSATDALRQYEGSNRPGQRF